MASIALIVNPKADYPVQKHIEEYCDTSNGAFRELQILERVSRVVSHVLKQMQNGMATFFDGFAKSLNAGWVALTLPRLPKVTREGVEAGKALLTGPTLSFREGVQKIHDVAEGIATWLYAALFFTGSSVVKTAADIPDLIVNVSDTAMAAQDLLNAKSELTTAKDAQLQTRLRDTVTYNYMKLVKSVASVASAILGMLMIALGGPVLPAIAFIAMGLTSSVAALSAHFFKETRPYAMFEQHKEFAALTPRTAG
jgi:hypothetical protein